MVKFVRYFIYPLLSFLPFILFSCKDKLPVEEGEFSVSVQMTGGRLTADKGGVFVVVKASGNWTLSLDAADSDEPWGTLSHNSGTGNKSNVILTYEANNSERDRSMDIVLESDGKETRYVLIQRGRAEVIGPENPNVPGSVPEWLELPAFDTDDYTTFAYHRMNIGNTPFRNYSYCYNENYRVSYWVAYPMNKWIQDDHNVGRYGSWMYDPNFSSGVQPNWIGGGIGPQGYSRGHQIPSEDRQNYDSNQQTFYMTNVTPQNQAFNESGWLTLENKVRSWAFASDTLYVVSGCVVSDKSKTIRDNNGRSVPVPDAYYKVLLRYSKSSTFGFSGYSAAAFYLEHEHNRVTLTNEHMMSVDELEKKLGMDFFVNLPDDIENKVEQQNPKNITWWSVN